MAFFLLSTQFSYLFHKTVEIAIFMSMHITNNYKNKKITYH